MSNLIITQTPSNHKQALLADWLRSTDRALEALWLWRWHLAEWQKSGAPITDAAFMAIVQEMSEAGLLEWLDGGRLDALREAMALPQGGNDNEADQ